MFKIHLPTRVQKYKNSWLKRTVYCQKRQRRLKRQKGKVDCFDIFDVFDVFDH